MVIAVTNVVVVATVVATVVVAVVMLTKRFYKFKICNSHR
jgi:hypothetical protein